MVTFLTHATLEGYSIYEFQCLLLNVMEDWNNAGADLHLVDRAPADITIYSLQGKHRAMMGMPPYPVVGQIDPGPWEDDELYAVLLHEIGHALGLPHSTDPTSVMHPHSRNLHLSPRDVDILQYINRQ